MLEISWPVFYITNRKYDDRAVQEQDIAHAYTTNQSLAGNDDHWFDLGFIQCDMKNHRRGDEVRDSVFRSLERLDKEEFVQKLMTALQERHEIVMFVHGFNVTWHDALETAAQLTWDTSEASTQKQGKQRIALLFDWASLGNIFAYAGVPYENDEGRIDEAQEMLPQLLDILCNVQGVQAGGPGPSSSNSNSDVAATDEEGIWQALHIVAHSMGNLVLQRGLSNALYDPMRTTQKPRTGFDMLRQLCSNGTRLTITFAAPDVDRASMRSMLNNLSGVGRCTLYCSRHDVPLGFSTLGAILRGYDLRGRAGYYSWGPMHRRHSTHIFFHPVVQTVKVSGAGCAGCRGCAGIRGDITGHSYFCKSLPVLDDISAVMGGREARPAIEHQSRCNTCRLNAIENVQRWHGQPLYEIKA